MSEKDVVSSVGRATRITCGSLSSSHRPTARARDNSPALLMITFSMDNHREPSLRADSSHAIACCEYLRNHLHLIGRVDQPSQGRPVAPSGGSRGQPPSHTITIDPGLKRLMLTV